MNRLAVIGSKAFGALFTASALGKLAGFDGTRRMMESYDLPLAGPGLALAISTELAAATAVFAGYRPVLATSVMIGYVLVVSAALPARSATSVDKVLLSRAVLLNNAAIVVALLLIRNAYANEADRP